MKTSARSPTMRSARCRKSSRTSISSCRPSTATAASISPDPLGDLLFNGIAQTAYRRSIATGTQGDGSYRLSPDHTLRAGVFHPGRALDFGDQFAGAAARRRRLPALRSAVLRSSTAAARPAGSTASTSRTNGKSCSNLTVNFGARFDLVDAFTHEHQFSPRINVVWQPTETTTLKAGYARYFTPPPFELVAPTTIALLANTTAAPEVTADSPLKAERDDYFDIGVNQVVLPGLKVGVDAYYKIAKNLIDEGQFGAPIILTPFNYAKGFVKGVELTASYDVDNWSLYGNFAISKALGKNITSGQFNFSPDDLAFIAGHYIHLDHDQTYTASAGVAYTFPTETKVSVDLIHGSGLRAGGDTPNGHSLPDYNQVNLSLVQKVDTGWWKGLELRLDVINLFDQQYEIRDGTGVGVGAPQFGPRRTILAGLTQRF